MRTGADGTRQPSVVSRCCQMSHLTGFTGGTRGGFYWFQLQHQGGGWSRGASLHAGAMRAVPFAGTSPSARLGSARLGRADAAGVENVRNAGTELRGAPQLLSWTAPASGSFSLSRSHSETVSIVLQFFVVLFPVRTSLPRLPGPLNQLKTPRLRKPRFQISEWLSTLYRSVLKKKLHNLD